MRPFLSKPPPLLRVPRWLHQRGQWQTPALGCAPCILAEMSSASDLPVRVCACARRVCPLGVHSLSTVSRPSVAVARRPALRPRRALPGWGSRPDRETQRTHWGRNTSAQESEGDKRGGGGTVTVGAPGRTSLDALVLYVRVWVYVHAQCVYHLSLRDCERPVHAPSPTSHRLRCCSMTRAPRDSRSGGGCPPASLLATIRRSSLPSFAQTVCLIALLALCGVACTEAAGASVVWVSPTGTEGVGCGLTVLTPCLTLHTALLQLLPLSVGVTPVVWLLDGTYTGAGNRDIALAPYLPLRLAAVNSGAAILDAQLLGPIFNITTDASSGDPVTATSIEGLVLKNGLSVGYGAVLVRALGPHVGSAITFRQCTFEGNQAMPHPVPMYSFTAPFPSAPVAIINAHLPNSDSVAQHPSLVPWQIPTQSTASSPTQPPDSSISPVWISRATTPPLAASDLPSAVAFVGCTFRANMVVNPFMVLYSQFAATSALSVHASHVSLMSCTFTAHNTLFPVQQAVAQFSGTGATVIDSCAFTDNAQPLILSDAFDTSLFGGTPAGHNLLLVRTTFARNGDSSPAGLAAPSGYGFFGGLLFPYGWGNSTLVNCTIQSSFGTVFTLSGDPTAKVTVVNTIIEDITLGSQSLITEVGAQPIVFIDSTIQRCTSKVSIIATAILATAMHFERCTFAHNTATAIGGLFDMRAATATVIVRLAQCIVHGNNAVSGAIVSVLSTSAKFVLDSCNVTDNNAANNGGTFILASSEVWITNSIFSGNSAPTGGAITGQAGSTVYIFGGEMTHNLASQGGALYFEPGAMATVTNVRLVSNRALLDGGAVYDASFVTYTNVVFDSNIANSGAGLFIPQRPLALVPLPAALVLADSPSCSVALTNVTFVRNYASTVGAGIMFDSVQPPCIDFCGAPLSDWSVTDGGDWISHDARCNFTANVALSGYGRNFGLGLHHVAWVSPTGVPPIAPGVDLDLSLQLYDSLNRTMGVTGGGVDAFNFLLLVFDAASGELLSALPTPVPTGVAQLLEFQGTSLTAPRLAAAAVPMSSDELSALPVAGVVTFKQVHLIAGVGSAVRLAVVSSDRSVLPTMAMISVAPCPAGLSLLPALLSSPSGSPLLSCRPRPAFLSGDALDVKFDVALVLLSLFVCVIGTWTTLILIEQVSARARKHRFVHWVALCTAALGVSGIWSSSVIAVSSVRITNHITGESLPFDLDPAFLFGALGALVALPFLGLCVAVSDPDFSAAQKAQMKGLRKLMKYQKFNLQPAWRKQGGAEEDSMPSDDESALRDTSIQRNSLLKSVHTKDNPLDQHGDGDDIEEYLQADGSGGDSADAADVPA